MPWRDLRWPAALGEPPTIRSIGRSVFRGPSVGRWRLDFWCLHLYRYRADLLVNGQPIPIRSGYAGILPPHADTEYRFHGVSEHLCAHFFLPAAREAIAELPAMQDLGKSFADYWRLLDEAIGHFPSQPRRAEARLWDLLWRLSDARTSASPPSRYRRSYQGPWHRARGVAAKGPALAPVEVVRGTIERRLGQDLTVAALAREAGLSHNHLTRLFRAATGQTVVGYIRARRVERARHLLMHSTQPIKAIAAEVGMADLHLFNKTIRRALGLSPRAIRLDREAARRFK